MNKNRIIALVALALMVAVMAALSGQRNQKKVTKTTADIQKAEGVPVQVSTVRFGSIDDSIPVTGDLTALNSVTLSSKIAGKIAAVAVREGDRVRRGQVVVQLEQTDQIDALRQARAALTSAYAGLDSAQARLSQARTNKSVTTVQSGAAIEQAKAVLAAAQANYDKVKTGARTQERMVAQNQVITAKANLDNASASLRRTKSLVTQGAMAQAQLDVAQTQYDVAQAQYNSAKESMSMVEEGARNEDVRAAQAQVQQAAEALKTAQANAAQVDLRSEDINTAQAGVAQANALVAQAKAQVGLAEQQLVYTSIVSPIDGIVSKRMTEPGQTVGAGGIVMEAVDVRTVYFLADVSETILSKVHPGQVVNVKIDAYPGQSYIGRVDRIYPAASTANRNFSARINIPNPGLALRPGMFARGTIVTINKNGALLVPQSAVLEEAGQSVVYTLESGKGGVSTAREHKITKGLSNPDYVEVVPPSDISDGAKIITVGRENLTDGAKVHVGTQEVSGK